MSATLIAMAGAKLIFACILHDQDHSSIRNLSASHDTLFPATSCCVWLLLKFKLHIVSLSETAIRVPLEVDYFITHPYHITEPTYTHLPENKDHSRLHSSFFLLRHLALQASCPPGSDPIPGLLHILRNARVPICGGLQLHASWKSSQTSSHPPPSFRATATAATSGACPHTALRALALGHRIEVMQQERWGL